MCPTLSDNELRYILWRSYKNLAESGNGVFSQAEDIAKQNELKVGEFSSEDNAEAEGDLFRMGDDAITAYHEQVNQGLFRKTKTSDFFDGNIGTFDAKHPYFLSKKSDVLQLPDHRLSPPTKKVFFKILHFLHPPVKPLVFTGHFG